MNKTILTTILIAGLLALTAPGASSKELCQRGFQIQFDLTKWLTCEPCTVIYTGNSPHGGQNLIVTRPVPRTAVEGRVRNEFFRTITRVNLHFIINDAAGRPMGEQVVSLYNLGPQESADFSVALDNSSQGALLTGFDFVYKDGTCEKISLR